MKSAVIKYRMKGSGGVVRILIGLVMFMTIPSVPSWAQEVTSVDPASQRV